MTTQIKPVTVPREVADAIEYLRSLEALSTPFSNEDIAHGVITGGGDLRTTFEVLRKIPFDTLMRALLDGYERELTEEEARELAYEELRAVFNAESSSEFSRGFDAGVEFTLNTLGIVITGINDAKGGAA